MNIDHIESFIYVVEYKSVHKAANVLFLSQPTISARIKSLEESLNVQLFIRSGRSLSLSKEGQHFLPYAQEIVALYRKIQMEIRTL
ncbi:LysR family transcriptional regulator [Solibacillus sp. FSL W7-1324]|uniref:LysR family transcriptional regulator n=1 Tax=Solibacillus sp. FSL W7-1324 TaxID=2921701 RepID=UPI0030F8161F